MKLSAKRNISQYHADFAKAHADIPWGDAYLLRNQVAHGYFKVDWEIVWRTIQTDLPQLTTQIQAVLASGRVG